MKKDLKISQESAEAIFLDMKNTFGFNISDAKVRELSMIVSGTVIKTEETYDPAKEILRLIQEGRIEFNSEKNAIKFNLLKPMEDSSGTKFQCFNIGTFTFDMASGLGIPLSELQPRRLSPEKLKELFGVMTGVSDVDVFGKLSISELNCLSSVAEVFLD